MTGRQLLAKLQAMSPQELEHEVMLYSFDHKTLYSANRCYVRDIVGDMYKVEAADCIVVD